MLSSSIILPPTLLPNKMTTHFIVIFSIYIGTVSNAHERQNEPIPVSSLTLIYHIKTVYGNIYEHKIPVISNNINITPDAIPRTCINKHTHTTQQ